MCGIAGIIAATQTHQKNSIQNMVDALKHRGPNHQGVFTNELISLGHTRLSIIDTSDKASQPMISKDGEYIVTFNGEIFNFKDIKNIHLKSCQFRTDSDTEVLLHLITNYDIEQLLLKLRGMFAFGIWNNNLKELYLCRDRMGQKPLYYYWDNKNFVFASELNAIFKCPLVKKEVDHEAMQLYWQYGYIPPPYSAYKNIFKLPPGSYLKLKNNKVEIKKYWNLEFTEDISDEKYATEELEKLLRQSVKYRMISDVPLGAFLSGGLDSSLITSFMTELSSKQIQTYSIGFDDKSFDETQYAKKVSEHLKTEHHHLVVKCAPEELVEDLVEHFGEPFGDSSAIPLFYLSKFTKKNLTVALSGDGADELFGGYNRYKARAMMNYYHKIPKIFRKYSLDLLLKLTKESNEYYQHSFFKKIRSFQSRSNQTELDKDNFMPNIFEPKRMHELLGNNFLQPIKENPIINFVNQAKDLEKINQMLYVDILTYLEGDINVKVDRMSMANSLEVRSPFLDHEVVEFSGRLDRRLKLKGFTTKYLLKKIAEKRLPNEIIYRKKQGFGIPAGNWFKNELKSVFVEKVLNNNSLPLNKDYINNLSKLHFDSKRDYGIEMWHLLIYSVWYKKNH